MKNTNTLLPDIKFRFNIEHPNLEDCYLSGYECALAEINEEENPFRPGSKENEQWMEGWWAGFYGEEPLYEIAIETDDSLIKVENKDAANDHFFSDHLHNLFYKFCELTGMLAVSVTVGYQLVDLVA